MREICIPISLRYYPVRSRYPFIRLFVSSDLANTNEEGRYTRKAHVHLSSVQNHGEKRRSIDYRAFDQLCNRHMAADGSRSGALDTSRHGHDLPIVRLNHPPYKDSTFILSLVACA